MSTCLDRLEFDKLYGYPGYDDHSVRRCWICKEDLEHLLSQEYDNHIICQACFDCTQEDLDCDN
jgi:hypothetical protein